MARPCSCTAGDVVHPTASQGGSVPQLTVSYQTLNWRGQCTVCFRPRSCNLAPATWSTWRPAR